MPRLQHVVATLFLLSCGSVAAIEERLLITATQSARFNYQDITEKNLDFSLIAEKRHHEQIGQSFQFQSRLGDIARTHLTVPYDISYKTTGNLVEPVQLNTTYLRQNSEIQFDSEIFTTTSFGGLLKNSFFDYCKSASCLGAFQSSGGRASAGPGRARNGSFFLSPDLPIKAAFTTTLLASGTQTTQWALSGEAKATMQYWALPTSDYVAQILEYLYTVQKVAGLDAHTIAHAAVKETVALRRWDPGTTSQNAALRDAEYAFLAYANRAQSLNEFEYGLGIFGAMFTHPAAIALYGQVKTCANNHVPGCAGLRDAMGHFGDGGASANPEGLPYLPSSPPGGTRAARLGWDYAELHPNDILGLADYIRRDTDRAQAFVESNFGSGVSSALEVVPTVVDTLLKLTYRIVSDDDIRPLGLPKGQLRSGEIEPAESIENDVGLINNLYIGADAQVISSIYLAALSPEARNLDVELFVNGDSFALIADTRYEFSQLAGSAVDSFILSRKGDRPFAWDFDIQLAFAQTGVYTFVAIESVAAVPENSSLTMFASGILTLFGLVFRHKNGWCLNLKSV